MTIKEILNWEQDDSLFSKKDMYLCSHDERGQILAFKELSESFQRRLKIDNMHIANGLRWQLGEKFPKLKPYTGTTNLKYVSYNDRKRYSGEGCMLGFFLYDYVFDKQVWNKLERVTREIHEYDVVLAPDYSLYVGEKWTIQNTYNMYKSCVIAAYWQQCGMNVIPVASWGDANSFAYCFIPLPENSVIAVCGTGHNGNAQRHHLWVAAIRELVSQKHPIKILVYGGKPCVINGLDVELEFIEDFITKRFRHEK